MATTASAVTVVGGPLSGGGWRLSWPTTRLSSASTARTAREGEKRPSWAEKRTVLENFAAGDVATVLDALDLEVEWIEASQGSCLITTPTTDETEWSNGVFGPTFASFDERSGRLRGTGHRPDQGGWQAGCPHRLALDGPGRAHRQLSQQ